MKISKEEQEIEKKQYMVDVFIPPECLDPDGGDCPHTEKKEKTHFNPV